MSQQELPELYEIDTLEALRVFADPLRQQIIEALLDGSKTVKQIAQELDRPPTKLYYHINLLEEYGLLRVTETRIVSGIIEKQYSAAAQNFRIKRTLLMPGVDAEDGLMTAFDAMIEPLRGDLQTAMARGLIDMADAAPNAAKLRMWRTIARLDPAHADAFYARLEALMDEFAAHETDSADENAQNYALLVTVFPTPRKARRKRIVPAPSEMTDTTPPASD